ncbi:hypothetical protein BBJ28_00011646 [Nothophytophthora sp. Chile5]|nr:hypothetical protein BBJ28_00011646 [Nothophytophthora sp. Chile5]
MARKAAVAAAVGASHGLRRNGARIRKALEVCDLVENAQRVVRASPPLRVLGLDINTNSTGFAIVTERGRVCRWGHVSTTQFASADVLQISAAIDEALADVHAAVEEQGTEWLVGIEAFMRLFRVGQFHNAGIFQLAQLNGIVSYACWKRFEALPTHTHPSAARGFFGLSAPSSSSVSKKSSIKQQVMSFFAAQEPALTRAAGEAASSLELPRFERTRSGVLADSAFDIADAYVIAAYTRCMHFQQQLLREPQLSERFSTRYLELTHEAARKRAKKQPISPELLVLDAMDDLERHAYLQELFAFGTEQWVKKHSDCFMLHGEMEADTTDEGLIAEQGKASR